MESADSLALTNRVLPVHHGPMAAAQLTRSETDKRIAGICGGIAEYFNLDPTLVRVGAVVAGLMGWGVVAYVVMWIVVPKASTVAARPVATGGGGTSSAIRIAEERYARGEITAEELAKIRADLIGR
jgi:phage shock protein C